MPLLNRGVERLKGEFQKFSQLLSIRVRMQPQVLSNSKAQALNQCALLHSMNVSFPTLPALISILKSNFYFKSES